MKAWRCLFCFDRMMYTHCAIHFNAVTFSPSVHHLSLLSLLLGLGIDIMMQMMRDFFVVKECNISWAARESCWRTGGLSSYCVCEASFRDTRWEWMLNRPDWGGDTFKMNLCIEMASGSQARWVTTNGAQKRLAVQARLKRMPYNFFCKVLDEFKSSLEV